MYAAELGGKDHVRIQCKQCSDDRKKHSEPCLSVDRLRHLLDYDDQAGVLTFRVARGGRKKGALAGTINSSGYRQLRIDGRLYLYHRVIFAYCTGRWPHDEVDHVDGVILNNRFSNLREVDRSGNQQNIGGARRTNLLGVLGVRKQANRYVARIRIGGKPVHLGSFLTLDLAQQAYLAAKKQHHLSGRL